MADITRTNVTAPRWPVYDGSVVAAAVANQLEMDQRGAGERLAV
jgi:hypothetical protein